ncbi:MAG: phage tail protein [Finegoldia magna]|nr:phage tail protein [Finegoldia magna]
MLKLLDNTEKIKREIETLGDPCWHEKLNGLNVLEFTTLDRDIKNKDRVVFQDELGIWHEFIVESIDDTHEDVFVYCEDSFYETRGDYIDDKRFVSANFSTVADAVMSYTRWNFKVLGDLGKGTVNFYHTDVKSAVFEDMQNKFNFEIKTYVEITNSRISQRVIELRKQRGHDNGKRFTYDKDITSISRTIDSTEFCTALYAYGKGEETENGGYGRRIDLSQVNDGKKYVENTNARDHFGKYVNGKREHIFATYIFGDIDDRKKLLEQAKKKLKELSEFKVTYKCDVLVLNKLLKDRAHEGIELGDTVAIIDKDINIRVRARVVERKSYLNSTKADEIVLGNFIEDYATQQAKIKSDLKSISNTINEQGQAITDLKNFDYYATIVQELNDRINATGGYVYISKDGQGLITYDKPIDKNPTKAIQLKGGAIRIANSKRSDGSWNWTTFGTGDGFTADMIIAGILQGGKVRWNLEDGTFLIGNSISDYNFYWDGSTLHMRDVDIDLTNNSVVKNMNQNIDKNNEDIKKANDVITQTQTSVQILKDSISSKVSKTEILSDKEIQNAIKGRDGADGADGSNFTWNLLKGSNVKVENADYRIAKYELAEKPTVGEDYTLTIWGELGEGKKFFSAYNSGGSIAFGALTKIKDRVYQTSFKWVNEAVNSNGYKLSVDDTSVWIYTIDLSVKSTSTIDKIKLEKGTNSNPVWSPHVSEIKGDKGEQGLRGLQGNNGKDGIPGKDGVSSFTHIAYSNSIDGSKDFSTNNSNREYIGIYVDSNKTDSEDYKSYKWSKIKGLDGKNGIPGKAGADGKTPYLHIAYSNSVDGKLNFSTTDSVDKSYIGQYTDFVQADSTDHTKYKWSLIKGTFEGVIGARNYLLDSAIVINTSAYQMKVYYLAEKPITGEDYTLTIWGSLGADRKSFGAYNSGGTINLGHLKKIADGVYQATFKWANTTSNGYTADDSHIRIYQIDSLGKSTSTINKIKLEKGNTGTDWSPAPEDLLNATKIVRNEFESFRNQTNEAFTDKVSISSYNANNKQIQQQISNVTQTANSITQRVSNIDKRTSDLATKYSQVKQTTDSISSTVSSKLGKTEVQSLIKQTVDNITIKASQIDFSGNVSITGELRTKYYSGNTALWMKNDSLKAYEDNTYNNEIGYFGGRAWSDEAYPYHLSISHGMDYHTTISYEGSSNYHPYILFDAYNNVDPSFVDSSGNATIRKHQYDPVGGIKYMMRELHTERNYFTDKVFHQDHVWVQKDLYFGNGVGIERAGRDDYVAFGKMSQVGGVATGGLKFMSNGRVYTEGSVFVNNEIRWNGNYPIFFGNGYGIQLTSSYIAIGRITSDGTVRDGIYIQGTELRALRDNKLGATLN